MSELVCGRNNRMGGMDECIYSVENEREVSRMNKEGSIG
jgi:hypothetical protein